MLNIKNVIKPKFKKGDRCAFIYTVGKDKIISILDDNMVIDGEPFWNDEWWYPIQGKANPTEESLLILYKEYKKYKS